MRKIKFLIMLVLALGATAANAQISVQDTVCAGATAQKYWVTKTVGSTYNWTLTGGGSIASGQTTDTIVINWASSLGTDTLKVTETNADGCTGDPVALAVTRVSVPLADAGSDETIGACSGQSVQLDASTSTGAGTLSYAWAPAAGLSATNIVNPVANPTSTTTYTLTVTSSHGCSATDAVVVTVDAAPLASVAANDTIGSCAGQSATLDGSGSTGTGLSYAWSNGAGSNATAVVSPTSTTTYTLTVTDNHGCTSTAQQVIAVEAAPVADAATNKTSIGSCSGQSASLSAAASTGASLSYSWTSNPAGFTSALEAPSVSPAVNTTYTLEVSDRHGCTSTDQVSISIDLLPVASAGLDDTLCNGSSTSLNAGASTGSNITYSWSSSPGSFASTSATPSVSPTVNTTYTLTVTDDNGCTSTDDVVVVVYEAPIANAGAYLPFCAGEAINLVGTASHYTQLTWTTSGDGTFTNNGTLTPTYTPGSADNTNGTVSITLTAEGNSPCADNSDVEVITINPKPTTSPIFHY